VTDSTASSEGWPRLLVAWYGVAVLTLAYTVSFIDRTILGLLIEPIKADLGLTDTQISLLHGLAFAVFYTVMGIPLSWIADHGSRRRLIAAGIAFWSVMTAACGLAQSYWQLFAARVGVGVGEAALTPAAYSLIADSVPPRHLGRALGVFSSGVYLGAGLAYLLGGAAVDWLGRLPPVVLPGVGELEPWQATFVLVGLPPVVLAALAATMHEPARKLKARPASGGSRADFGAFWRSTRAPLLAHIGGFTCLVLVFNAMNGWAPTLLIRIHGLSAGEAGMGLGAIIVVCGGGGIVAGGALMDRWRARGLADAPMRVGILSALGVAPFAAAAPLMPRADLVLAALAPFMFFSSLAFGAAAAGLQMIAPNRVRGRVSAVYLFVNNLIGIGLGSVGIALLTDYVFEDEMALGSSMAIGTGLPALIGAALLFGGLRPFREAVKRMSV